MPASAPDSGEALAGPVVAADNFSRICSLVSFVYLMRCICAFGYRTGTRCPSAFGLQLGVDPQPWLRAHATHYPPSEIYWFKPLDQRVSVYASSFRLVEDVTILATPEIQKLLAATPTVTVSGALEYQACDEKVCCDPARVPFSVVLR